MPNHVHVVAVPSGPEGLARTFAEAHRRYTKHINARNRWTGNLWQSHFGSVTMDEEHLAAAVAYVIMNPVRARLADQPEVWRWPGARAYLAGVTDGLTTTGPMLSRFPDFSACLESQLVRDEAFTRLRRAEQSGRPLGSPGIVEKLEQLTSRRLTPQRRGPKPRSADTIKG